MADNRHSGMSSGNDYQDSSVNSSSGERSSVDLTGDELEERIMEAGAVKGYQFEPVYSDGNGSSLDSDSESSESEDDAVSAK